ncbi:hypothetical protein [Oceanisphaera sp. W20_SRM_FM3]|uniref:hypothetical protein n=1 Tax=Oceanisphaera sp. W20_SRM_FM3 TaxID=3240267 RepID=UPI003F970F69
MAQLKVRKDNFTVDYTRDTLPELFLGQTSDCDFSASDLIVRMNCSDVILNIKKARQTLLIACQQIKDAMLIQQLCEQADNGIRIYLLLGDETLNQSAIDTLSGRCLIRGGVVQQGTLIIVDHITNQSEGFLLTDHQVLVAPEAQAWTIELESQQREDSVRSFCKIFWEDAETEYLQQNRPQSALHHPDGTIVTNHSHQLRGALQDNISAALETVTGVSNLLFKPQINSYQLLLSGNAPDISQLARHGVALTDKPIPSLLLSDDGNWLLPNAAEASITNWCLQLSNAQSEKLEHAYRQALLDASWQFKSSVCIGELQSQQELRFVELPELVRSVESVRDHTLQDIYTESIDEFLNERAQELAQNVLNWQPDLLAHQINYQVTIHPPYSPADASKDALYDAWSTAEKDWQGRIASLDRQQRVIDEQQAGIPERLKGFLKSFLLGQGHSVKQLDRELALLKDWSVTQATPAERTAQQKILIELHERIRQRSKDTAEKQDAAVQQDQWENERTMLEKQLSEIKLTVDDRLENRDQLLAQVPIKEQQINSSFISDWKKSTDSLADKQLQDAQINDLQPEQFLPDVQPEDKEQELLSAKTECLRQKREALRTMTVEHAQQWKISFKEKVWKKHYGALDRVLENHRLALQKIKRDLQEIEKAVSSTQSQLESAQTKLNNHGQNFVYQADKSSALDQQLGIKDTSRKLASFTWPAEELPMYGAELRNLNKQRYLVIFNTDHLEQARRDAKTLNSKIVCDKEFINA